MSEMVTIASFTEPLEADMARLRLQSAGIETFLAGENARILEPGLGPLQLKVRAEDETDARAIMADKGLPDEDREIEDRESGEREINVVPELPGAPPIDPNIS